MKTVKETKNSPITSAWLKIDRGHGTQEQEQGPSTPFYGPSARSFPCTTLCSGRPQATCLPHEGDVEQIFSLGGRLSDPNMNPAYLATLVFVGSNIKVYMPPKLDIWQRYLRKFSIRMASCSRLTLAFSPLPRRAQPLLTSEMAAVEPPWGGNCTG